MPAPIGDTRRICDLFDLSIDSAGRYLDTLEDPDLANGEQPRSGNTDPHLGFRLA